MYVLMTAEVVKVASLQPLHRMVYTGSPVAADHEAAVQLINHLMDCLTLQVSQRRGRGGGGDGGGGGGGVRVCVWRGGGGGGG